MRRTRVTQPLMQKQVKELQSVQSQAAEEMSGVYKEFGNPLAGCFPVLLQMPVLFALLPLYAVHRSLT